LTLARVFCGIAAADVAPWLTVAVVDDAGRLLDLRHLSDDPAGYAQLGGLLADRSTGITPVGLDRGDHLIGQLLAAARQPLAVADENVTNDFAERFSDDTSYDEMRAPFDQRRAVGLARALQAGALHAMIQNAAIDLDELKPVLGAHAAIAAGRQAAATALREVLRELYPAALRAYPDPAEFIPLKVLDALPEPGLLTASPSSRQREASIIGELAATGVTDAQTAANAISALRASVEEAPRWSTNRALAPVVGETVRQAVAAVRAADAASAALVSALVERLGQLRSNWSDERAAPRPYLVSGAPVSPAPRRIPGPAAEVPANRLAPRSSAASAAANGIPAAAASFAPTIPAPRSAQVGWSEWPSDGYEPAAAASPGYAASGYSPGGSHAYDDTGQQPGYGDTTPSHAYGDTGPQPRHGDTTPSHGFGDTGSHSRVPQPGFNEPTPQPTYPGGYASENYHQGCQHPDYPGGYTPASGYAPSNGYPADSGYGTQPAGYGSPLPSRGAQAPSAQPSSAQPSSAQPSNYLSPAEPSPPVSFDDLVTTLSFSRDPLTAPLQPPASAHTPSSSNRPGNGYGGTDNSWTDTRFPPAPAPRMAESRQPDPLTDPLPSRASAAVPRPARSNGNGGEPDESLLIFSQTQSAWFTFVDEGGEVEPLDWTGLADDGWRAAEHLTHPTVGAATPAGLPRRVPQANLVPGTAQSSRQLRIVRDAQSIAAHTDGYFRGWRRGQEIGGYAVGQRDRAAWEFNRDQRARSS
jgi:hypothetical protein